MLKESVDFLVQTLAQYLRLTTTQSELTVAATSVFNSKGEVSFSESLGLSVVNIGQEQLSPRGVVRTYNSTVPTQSPSLSVLVVANPNQSHVDGLFLLEHVRQCFAKNSVLNRTEHPAMPKGLERVTLAYENLSLEARYQLWQTLGGSYLPSLLYNVRVQGFSDNQSVSVVPVPAVPSGQPLG